MQYVKDILKGELIGRNTRAVNLKNKDVFEGEIVDETKNTVVLQTSGVRKRLVKTLYSFGFVVQDKTVIIDGKYFNKKPEERIKSKLRW
ncbi:MAG: ribonuclease P protein subunit [Candidatus Woesearchaeota archaeon]